MTNIKCHIPYTKMTFPLVAMDMCEVNHTEHYSNELNITACISSSKGAVGRRPVQQGEPGGVMPQSSLMSGVAGGCV